MSALALDRQAIEKKDFPVSRRGYDPEAVDRHLAALAAEFEQQQERLDRAERAAAAGATPPSEPAATRSLSVAASEQVRLIVDAAERSAAEIEGSAREDASRLRADADAEAARTRDEAIARSQDHIGNVGQATRSMLQRVDAMESELAALLESLRTGTNRLSADLSLLHGDLGDVYEGEGRAPRPAPAAAEAEAEPLASEPEFVDDPVAIAPAVAVAVTEPPDPAPQPDPEPVAEEAPEPVVDQARQKEQRGDGDVDGARLIALNMALNGQSREETGTYLRDNYDLRDRDALLDEVYATVEG